MYATHTIQGLRPYNEDRVSISSNLDGNNTEIRNIDYFALFDGHGGNEISEYLKNELIEYIIKYKSDIKSNSFNDYIIKTFDIIQKKLTNYHIKSKICGSTALISILYNYNKKQYVKIINLGDCRAIICNSNNIAIPLSVDHKPMSYNEYYRIKEMKGNITIEEGDDPRICGMAVSRAFGDLDAKPYVSHEPDIYNYEITSEKFIVLGCDGVWDVLSNQDVVDFVLFELKRTKNLKKICKKLTQYALDKGSQDNITVIIVLVK